jgi:hypothetical protein
MEQWIALRCGKALRLDHVGVKRNEFCLLQRPGIVVNVGTVEICVVFAVEAIAFGQEKLQRAWF